MSTEKLHVLFDVNDGIHIVQSWSLASDADLESLSVSSQDVGRIAHCSNEGAPSFFILARVAGGMGEWLPITPAAAGVADSPDTARHVYLAATGDDANDGLSPLTPRRTVAAAWLLLPATLYAPFTLHLGSGTYDWAAPPDSLAQVGARACITVVGDGGGQAGDDGCAVTSTGTIAAASTALAVNVSEALPVNARRGYTFESGGARRHVTANTAGQVSLSEGLPAFTTGTPYRLVRPGALLNMGAANASARKVLARCDLINFANVRIRGGNAELLAVTFASLFGVEIESQLFLGDHTIAGGAATFPFFRNPRVGNTAAYFLDWIAAAGLSATPVQWNGWGLAATTATPNVSQYQGIDFANGATYEGYLTMPMVGLGLGAQNVCMVLLGGALSNLITAAAGGRYHFRGAYLVGQGGGIDARETMNLAADTICTASAALTVQNSGNYDLLTVREHARITCLAPLNLSSGSATATHFIKVIDSAEAQLGAVNALNNVVIRAFMVAGSGRLSCTSWSGTNNGGGYTPSVVTDAGRATFGSAVVGGIHVFVGGVVTVLGTLDSRATYGCVVSGGRFIVGGSCLIANYQNGADQNGLKVTAGGEFLCTQNPSIYTAGTAPSYGVNCRGGGRFYCEVQPTGVVGPTSDFSVGSGAGEDFNDDALATALAAKMAGVSAVVRTK
jgi:hypothetical protein